MVVVCAAFLQSVLFQCPSWRQELRWTEPMPFDSLQCSKESTKHQSVTSVRVLCGTATALGWEESTMHRKEGGLWVPSRAAPVLVTPPSSPVLVPGLRWGKNGFPATRAAPWWNRNPWCWVSLPKPPGLLLPRAAFGEDPALCSSFFAF